MTQTIHVATAGGGGYPVCFGPIADLPQYLEVAGLKAGQCLIVTDDTVMRLHALRLIGVLESSGWDPSTFVVPAGESSKSAGMLQRLYDWALPLAIERTTPVFALGGGVVGDLAGFAASTLLRGLPLVHVPTTLLAQVDSSIGGKTGINHACGKNLIGSFYPPTLVLSDANALSTLPDREFYSGLAEVVKHAILDGGPLLRQMEESRGRLLQRDPSVLNRIIPEAASVKATIVSADEREGGIRAHLNLGHTTGHAIETVSGYGVFTHGEAVSVGMLIALMVSRSRHPESDFSSAWRLVASLPVSPSIRQLRAADLIAATAFDKKRDSGKMRFVLLRAPGAAYVDEIGDPEFEAAWERLPEEST